MHPDVWQLVTNKEQIGERAVLKGYQRSALRGLLYPGIFRNEHEKVNGLVYGELNDADWETLDRFEGNLYVRRMVKVMDPQGGVSDCYTYIAADSLTPLRTDRPWDFDLFTRDHLQDFLRTYGGF